MNTVVENIEISKSGSIMAVRPNLNKSGIVTIHETNNCTPRYSHAYSYSADMIYLKNAKPHISRNARRIFNCDSNKFPCASIVGLITGDPQYINWKRVFYNPKKDPFRFILSDGTEWKYAMFAKIQGREMWING